MKYAYLTGQYNWTLFIADLYQGWKHKHTLFVSVLQPNTTFYLWKRWGYLRRALIYRRRRSRVCNQWESRKTSCSII